MQGVQILLTMLPLAQLLRFVTRKTFFPSKKLCKTRWFHPVLHNILHASLPFFTKSCANYAFQSFLAQSTRLKVVQKRFYHIHMHNSAAYILLPPAIYLYRPADKGRRTGAPSFIDVCRKFRVCGIHRAKPC